jgi:thermitase
MRIRLLWGALAPLLLIPAGYALAQEEPTREAPRVTRPAAPGQEPAQEEPTREAPRVTRPAAPGQEPAQEEPTREAPRETRPAAPGQETAQEEPTREAPRETRPAAPGQETAQAEPTFEAPEEVQAVPGEFIIRFRDDAVLGQAASILAERGIEVVGTVDLINAHLIQLDPSAEVGALSEVLTALPGVESVEPNYLYFAVVEPNDTRYSEQWAWSKMQAPAAWDILESSPAVVVAVIDTGVDYAHEDLAANMWENESEIPGNGIDDDGNGITDDVHGANFVPDQATGDPMDDHSHGTHVAGTIGAVTNNGTGVAGTTWQTRIMALKFLDANGSGSVFNAIRAIEYAITNGAHIMSNSWGGYGRSQALEDAIGAARDAGILFVAAACNDNRNNDQQPCYPASYDVANVLAVMASDQQDQKAGFSNYGSTSVDIAAPGVQILSTVLDDGYDSFGGTSMAAPHVSGAAALVKGQNSSWQAPELKQRIMESADQIAALNGLSVTGGRLNLFRALGGGDVGEQVGACSLCWTCGGTWPYYGGTIPTRVGATERGASCAGNPVSSSDTIPYLCCRGW